MGTEAEESRDREQPSRLRRWLGLLCLLGAPVNLAVQMLTVRSLPGAIFAIFLATTLAGTGVYLAFPERIPTSWNRSIEGRPWLLAALVLLSILVPMVLFVLVAVTEYRR